MSIRSARTADIIKCGTPRANPLGVHSASLLAAWQSRLRRQWFVLENLSRTTMKKYCAPAAAAAGGLVLLSSIACAQEAAAPPAVYTTDQAAAGASVYAQSCAVCHGQALEGIAAPALKGDAFHEISSMFDGHPSCPSVAVGGCRGSSRPDYKLFRCKRTKARMPA